jgi:hypothetical protein
MSLGKLSRLLQTPLILALVAGIQSAQVLELRESSDPTDVVSLDPSHKGEDEGEWGIALVKQSSSEFVSSPPDRQAGSALRFAHIA